VLIVCPRANLKIKYGDTTTEAIPIITNIASLTFERRSGTTDVALLIDVSTINRRNIIESRTKTLLFLLAKALRKAVTLIVSFRISGIRESPLIK